MAVGTKRPATVPETISLTKASIALNERNIISNTRRDSTPTLTRRSVLRGLVGAGAAMVAGGTIGRSALAQSGARLYTVSANANFRSGPSTGYTILGVVRVGDTFAPRGIEQNGYAAITFQGQNGWVLASLVTPTDQVGGDPVISGSGWTTDTVNLRSGPSTGNQVLRVVPSGAKIGTSTTVQNGFRYVTWDGQTGWMYDAVHQPRRRRQRPGAVVPDDHGEPEPSRGAEHLGEDPAGDAGRVAGHPQRRAGVRLREGDVQRHHGLGPHRLPEVGMIPGLAHAGPGMPRHPATHVGRVLQ